MAGNHLCLAEDSRLVLLQTVLNVLAVHGDVEGDAGAGVAELVCACTVPVAEMLRALKPPLWVQITGSGAGCPYAIDGVVMKRG